MSYNRATKILKDKIKTACKNGLPGIESHRKMAPLGRIPNDYEAEPEDAQKSSVLIILYEKDNRIFIPFIERSIDGSIHSGQIALPGGKKESDDKNYIDTAYREAYEEIGIDPKYLEYAGSLSPLYIPISNFTVYPIIAFCKDLPQFSINPDEVKKLHIVNPDMLMKAKPEKKEVIINGQQYTVPSYNVNSTDIWGATAMIISEFIDILK